MGRKSIANDLKSAIVELRRRPGQWARLRQFKSKSGGSGAKKGLRDVYPDCEFRAAVFGAGSAVWGRFVEADD